VRQKRDTLISAVIDGKNISAPPGLSVIQALWYANYPQVKNVGCLSGACGSCRVLVRSPDLSDVTAALACQLIMENGMYVNFLSSPNGNQKYYKIEEINKYENVDRIFQEVFSEAKNCRHCGGCNVTCPAGIDVEQGVVLAAKSQYAAAGELFMSCVQCNLCETACPESIAPNHLGSFCRRVSTSFSNRPPNLERQLRKIRSGELQVKF